MAHGAGASLGPCLPGCPAQRQALHDRHSRLHSRQRARLKTRAARAPNRAGQRKGVPPTHPDSGMPAQAPARPAPAAPGLQQWTRGPLRAPHACRPSFPVHPPLQRPRRIKNLFPTKSLSGSAHPKTGPLVLWAGPSAGRGLPSPTHRGEAESELQLGSSPETLFRSSFQPPPHDLFPLRGWGLTPPGSPSGASG